MGATGASTSRSRPRTSSGECCTHPSSARRCSPGAARSTPPASSSGTRQAAVLGPAGTEPPATSFAFLRSGTGRVDRDRALTDLIGELAAESYGFARRWARHDVRFHRGHRAHPLSADR
ncbi:MULTISPECIES: MmyB family transcriptional regulator [unclassified Streptomyces]|uniref:MmyB family transcriptional regulator n=1 Tax=unclassified Streptomyces TaxID=2593676 RepID=UPI001F4586BF|nr:MULTISPECIES: hypothetical protein [unclassified Streptomyces]